MYLRVYVANKKELKEKGEASLEVLVARGRSERRRGRLRSKSRPRDVASNECFKCKKKGHWKNNYPFIKGGEKKKSTEIVNTITLDGEDFESMLVVIPSIRSTSEWILDSRCSYHMCPYKSLFYTLNEV